MWCMVELCITRQMDGFSSKYIFVTFLRLNVIMLNSLFCNEAFLFRQIIIVRISGSVLNIDQGTRFILSELNRLLN